MKPTIVIRADGGTSMGMGHIVRCLALAEMLKDDFLIFFAIQQPDESTRKLIEAVTIQIEEMPITTDYAAEAIAFTNTLTKEEIVILDGYHFNTEYQQAIKNKGCTLVCIDDLHAWHQLADVVINHAEGIDKSMYSAEPYTKFCLGLDFVLLRQPFLQIKSETRKIHSVKKIFISMGAADINNITQKFTEALIHTQGIEEIHLMLGAINPHLSKLEQLIEENKKVKIVKHFNISASELADLLRQCDVSICPASSISLESCAIGIGLISGHTANNQLGILSGLIKHKAAINFGDFNSLSFDEIKDKLNGVVQEPQELNELVNNQWRMIDGKSKERLSGLFHQLIHIANQDNLHFRFANVMDTNLYFEWANDDAVRANSFNQEPIPYDNHVEWFHSKFESPECFFYLFLSKHNLPVGQIRIDKSGDEIIIGISIDKHFRGLSLGSKMLKMACDDYLEKYPNREIVAYIKKENLASISIFMNAGFSDKQEVIAHNMDSYKLTKKF